MIIDGIEYVKKEEIENNVQICVLQRGWVFVGYFTQNGTECKLTKAKCIRKWGTTKGLGELALFGITKDTVLDDSGTVNFDVLTLVVRISTEENLWKNVL